jgi:hypothetical protein
MVSLLWVALVLVASIETSVSAWTTTSIGSRRGAIIRSSLWPLSLAIKRGDESSVDSDFPPDEETAEYKGTVDWDAEWKKVVKNGGTTRADRPGKEFYKSEAEIAAIVSGQCQPKNARRIASLESSSGNGQISRNDADLVRFMGQKPCGPLVLCYGIFLLGTLIFVRHLRKNLSASCQ